MNDCIFLIVAICYMSKPTKTKKKIQVEPTIINFDSNEESNEYKTHKVQIAQDKIDANIDIINGNISNELFKKIVAKLKPNQWLHCAFDDELDNGELNNVQETEEFVFKPDGLFFSKGEWLFQNLSVDQNYIYIADVDYSKIKVITDENDLFDFMQKYMNARRIKNQNQTKIKLLQEEGYFGFCIIPDPKILLNKLIKQNKINKKSYKSLRSYDVSTLVLWNPKEVITSLKCIMNNEEFVEFLENKKGKNRKLKNVFSGFIDFIK